jgi:hypothetical protein
VDANTHVTLAWFGSLPLANLEDLVSGTLSLVPRRAHVRMLLLPDARDDFAAQQLERFPAIGPLSRLGNVEHVMVDGNLGERPALARR